MDVKVFIEQFKILPKFKQDEIRQYPIMVVSKLR
ncbi:hypothetical protein HLPCO_001307 [Haloplasma contractile SSD-17B]|uniref:Uncharacterized protein n=1 Tax=Haloplasma contractile SSD-17B TaxID=1033810 RepID=U2EBZ5_9MOLU|nr:hypothetical protein HLPCO_001307 [Haloplasma contractile SSD-17B]